jgi:phosphatidylglycerol lysyltransferase
MLDPISRMREFKRLSSELARVSAGAVGARLHLRWLWELTDWPVGLVTGLTLAEGLASIASVLAVRVATHPRLFSLLLPLALYEWSRTLTLALGFIQIYLAFHLFRRQRAAWWLALMSASLSVVANVGRGELWYTALVPGGEIVLLVIFRRRFRVMSALGSMRRGLELAVASLLLALVYGTLGFWLLLPRDFGLNFHLVDALIRTLREFTLAGNADLVAQTAHADWFLVSLQVLGLVSAGVAVYSLFRPVVYRVQTLPQQRAAVRDLMQRYGGSATALDFFRLWPDKSYFFGEGQRACVAFKVARGIALALGDPVGPEDALEPTVAAFVQYCANNGWGVAFHQVTPERLPQYRRAGLSTIKVGENALVDLEQFAAQTANTRRWRDPRRKVGNRGYALVRYEPPHPLALLEQLEEVSREWLSLPGRRERSFTLGRFERGYLNETPLFAVQGGDGRIVAFVNQIPTFRSGETTVDLMRHRVQVPNGTMDFLFGELLLHLHATGYRTFDLGMVPLAGVGEAPDATLQERAAHQLAQQLQRVFSYQGLRAYKEKFQPVWRDRYMVYQGGPVGLLRTTIALVRATEG